MLLHLLDACWETYLVVYSVVQSLVGINSVVSIIWKFEYFMHRVWKHLLTPPEMGIIGDLAPSFGIMSTWPTKSTSLCRTSHIMCKLSKFVRCHVLGMSPTTDRYQLMSVDPEDDAIHCCPGRQVLLTVDHPYDCWQHLPRPAVTWRRWACCTQIYQYRA